MLTIRLLFNLTYFAVGVHRHRPTAAIGLVVQEWRGAGPLRVLCDRIEQIEDPGTGEDRSRFLSLPFALSCFLSLVLSLSLSFSFLWWEWMEAGFCCYKIHFPFQASISAWRRTMSVPHRRPPSYWSTVQVINCWYLLFFYALFPSLSFPLSLSLSLREIYIDRWLLLTSVRKAVERN